MITELALILESFQPVDRSDLAIQNQIAVDIFVKNEEIICKSLSLPKVKQSLFDIFSFDAQGLESIYAVVLAYQIFIETNFKNKDNSNSGAISYFQILPSTLDLYKNAFPSLRKESDREFQAFLVGVFKTIKDFKSALLSPLIAPLQRKTKLYMSLYLMRLIYHYGSAVGLKKFNSHKLDEHEGVYVENGTLILIQSLFNKRLRTLINLKNSVKGDYLIIQGDSLGNGDNLPKARNKLLGLIAHLKSYLTKREFLMLSPFVDSNESTWRYINSRLLIASPDFTKELMTVHPDSFKFITDLSRLLALRFEDNETYSLEHSVMNQELPKAVLKFKGADIFFLITSVRTDGKGNVRDSQHHSPYSKDGAIDFVALIDQGKNKYIWIDNLAALIMLLLEVASTSFLKNHARLHFELGHGHIDQDSRNLSIF